MKSRAVPQRRKRGCGQFLLLFRLKSAKAEAASRRFLPFRSDQPLLGHGIQDLRIVVDDAVHPRADGALLVGAGMEFPNQLKELLRRRGRIEPISKVVGIDNRRLSLVDVGKRRGGRRSDDGEGFDGFSTLVPASAPTERRTTQAIRPQAPESKAACRPPSGLRCARPLRPGQEGLSSGLTSPTTPTLRLNGSFGTDYLPPPVHKV